MIIHVKNIKLEKDSKMYFDDLLKDAEFESKFVKNENTIFIFSYLLRHHKNYDFG